MHVLKDGQLAMTSIAGPDAVFNISLFGLSSGSYNFSIYSEDSYQKRSTLFSFPVYIEIGGTTNVSGIFLAPTISTDKSEVKKGDDIVIFGQTTPNADVTISVHSPEEYFENVRASDDGAYLYYFDTSPLNFGEHITKSKSRLVDEVSPFGHSITFLVGESNKIITEEDSLDESKLKGDLNNDKKVNLVDFSIAAYWYTRKISERFKQIEIDHLNGDAKVDLIDFSVMAFYWTG